jgi:8-oxo-dGTP pyrophosphatase MutT (NUDIX family)
MRSPPAVRPRDAASLILLRAGRNGPEVLMGRRASRHRFVPGHFVFPGGRVDAGDHHAKVLSPLRAAVETRLRASCGPAKARGMAVAAVRETYEETGLVLGELREGLLLPSLDRLEYVMRAITPSASPIRFHARFFLADGNACSGELKSNGELLDLAWRSLGESLTLPLVDVTQYILECLQKDARYFESGSAALYCFVKGKARVR